LDITAFDRRANRWLDFSVKYNKASRQKELEMLVLSRQKDESIMIGDDVEITIVDVRGDKVRLGITAPKEIPVHRMEVYQAIQREKGEKQAQEQEH
jgi:carbon storage regulator